LSRVFGLAVFYELRPLHRPSVTRYVHTRWWTKESNSKKWLEILID
jgi:hypothetical protein